MENLSAQAPLLAVMALAVSALFVALQRIYESTIRDYRARLDGQQKETSSALVEIKDALKEIAIELRQRRAGGD